MLDYAIEYEIIDKNPARSFRMKEKVKHNPGAHNAFTDEELNILWEHSDDEIASIVLIHCYMGWRPTEICNIKLSDVNIQDWVITGGIKTENGINRSVPIHSKIRKLVQKKYDRAIELGSKYLFNCENIRGGSRALPMKYEMYQRRFYQLRSELNIGEYHTLHDCRKQFVTMAKAANIDEYALKRLAGHSIEDLTERVYTERSLDWLRSEIEKIK